MKKTILVLTALIVSLNICLNAQNYQRTNPEDIQVLYEYPNEYTVLGFIDASKEIGFSKSKAKQRALNKALKDAGKLGANAIVLQGYDKDNTAISSYMNINVIAIYVGAKQQYSNDNNYQKQQVVTNQYGDKSYNDYEQARQIHKTTYQVGDRVILYDEGHRCVGEIIRINKRNTGGVISFYHKRKGRIQEVKRSFGELEIYTK